MFSVFLKVNLTYHLTIQKHHLWVKEKATFKTLYLLNKSFKMVTKFSEPARALKHKGLLWLQAEKAELHTLPKRWQAYMFPGNFQAASHVDPIPYLHKQSSGLLFKQQNWRKFNMMYWVTCAPLSTRSQNNSSAAVRSAGFSASSGQRSGR